MLSIRTGLTARFIAGICFLGLAMMTSACAETEGLESLAGPPDAATEERIKKETEILVAKNTIKLRIERRVCGWKAGRLNSASVCEQSLYPKKCKRDMNVFRAIKALAEQDCTGDFAKTNKSFRSLCSGFKNNCAGVKENEMKICKAFVGKDSKAFAAIVRNANIFETYFDASSPENFREDSASSLMQLFSAFQKNSEKECLPIDQSIRSFFFQFLCRIAVGNKDPDELVEGLANDLYYLDNAKRLGEKGQCAEIQSDFIRNACIDERVNSLDAFLDF